MWQENKTLRMMSSKTWVKTSSISAYEATTGRFLLTARLALVKLSASRGWQLRINSKLAQLTKEAYFLAALNTSLLRWPRLKTGMSSSATLTNLTEKLVLA
jgi:hypothetical protein